MNAGNLSTSKRLQDTMAVLRDGNWHSSLEIAMTTCSVAPHSDLAGLRSNGIDIETRRDGKRYYYRVKGEGQ